MRMDKRLWQIDAEKLNELGINDYFVVRVYADDAGAAWLHFIEHFDPNTNWQSIYVREVKRNE